MRRMSKRFVGIAAWTAMLASPAQSDTQNWSRMAEEDLLAARALLLESHPGAVAELADETFQRQLRSGFDQALAIALGARTYGGYRAALQRFAASFDDSHIATAPLVQTHRHWPGFVVALQSDSWKVIARAADDAPPVGATLLSCDGRPPDTLAQERLAPFTGSWAVRGERIRHSTWLLQDVDNPQQPRLARCDFSGSDGPKTHQLRWRPVAQAEIGRRIGDARPFPSEEVWLRPFEQGFWIRLGTSGGGGIPIVAEAKRQERALRAAPFVVLDLRGNAGGASYITDELAKTIYGTARVAAARRPQRTGGPETIVWRASAPSLQRVEEYLQRSSQFAPADHPLRLGLLAQREALRKALASGAAFARAPAEVHRGGREDLQDRVRRPPRVILVTDRHCFSSCLLGVRLFRALGAEHVGEETRANTRYSDLRTVELPSGLSNFATMQSFSTWLPMEIGPYTPARQFEGDLFNDTAVQAWVSGLVRRSGGPAARTPPPS
ncbi:MAG TPA: hypothetical protein VK391_02425 [Allosphingosinicella sp.]|nr:hypothetical protein [Allosphingosinicella sp.]